MNSSPSKKDLLSFLHDCQMGDPFLGGGTCHDDALSAGSGSFAFVWEPELRHTSGAASRNYIQQGTCKSARQ